MLKPDLFAERLTQVDWPRLAERGIRYLCLDVDNTLARQGSWEPEEGVEEALQRAREAGCMRSACLVSNVILGARRRLAHLARRLRVEHVYGARLWDRKPGPQPFLWAMRRMGASREGTAVVGDQLFTDVLGGQRLGLFTVLVRPLGPDHWTTRLTGRRRREQAYLTQWGIGGYDGTEDGALREAGKGAARPG